MQKYLVIGGNGVLGHFLVRRLVRQGHRPAILSRSGDTTLVRDIVDQCDMVRGDMADGHCVDAIVHDHRVTHIAHLGAALPSVTEVDPATAVRLNVEATAHVLDAARRHGVRRVVMASSKAVYGRVLGVHDAPTYAPVPESLMPAPATMYGITKWASERLGDWYAANHGIEFLALRFGATIGPGKIARHGGSYSRYSVVLEHAMAGRPVEIRSGADAVCDALFNDEAARGIACALQAPRPAHGLYNICTGTGFTLRDYAAAVRRFFPRADITVVPDAQSSGNSNFILDGGRARDDLGFVADANVDRIVQAYVATMQLLDLTPDAAAA